MRMRAFPSRPGGRGTRACAPPPRTRQPPRQPRADPTGQPTNGSAARGCSSPGIVTRRWASSGINSRPSTARLPPARSSRQAPAPQRGGRTPPERVGDGNEMCPAASIRDLEQLARCVRPCMNPNASRTRSITSRAKTSFASNPCNRARSSRRLRLILELHAGHRSESASRSSASIYGAQVEPARTRTLV